MAFRPSALGLPRSRRLKQGRDFARLRAGGQRLAQGCLALNWLPRGPEPEARLGVITGRRLGDAHVRTRARRLLREAFRLHQHELREPLDLVLVARASIVGKKLQAVERDFLTVLRRAGLLQRPDARSEQKPAGQP